MLAAIPWFLHISSRPRIVCDGQNCLCIVTLHLGSQWIDTIKMQCFKLFSWIHNRCVYVYIECICHGILFILVLKNSASFAEEKSKHLIKIPNAIWSDWRRNILSYSATLLCEACVHVYDVDRDSRVSRSVFTIIRSFAEVAVNQKHVAQKYV